MVSEIIEALSNQLKLAMKNNDSLAMQLRGLATTNSNLNAELTKVKQENNQLVLTNRHMSERVAVLIKENADLHEEITAVHCRPYRSSIAERFPKWRDGGMSPSNYLVTLEPLTLG